MDNITLGNPDKTIDLIKEFEQLACVEEIIKNLPSGYNTVLTEGGFNLSKGQRQRICLLRALVCNPKVLILDEATSNLDVEVENKIFAAIDKKLRGKLTLVIVTHRINTIVNSDCIYVMKSGSIVAKGDHSTLIKETNYYKVCINQQTLLMK